MSGTYPLAVACSTRHVLALVVATLLLSITGAAQADMMDNPRPGFDKRYWKDSEGQVGYVWFETRTWDPAFYGWDGVFTKNNGVKVLHSFVEDSWPFVENSWPFGVYTSLDAKKYFDDKWDATSVGTAYPTESTYTYAFGWTGSWLYAHEILANDYQDANKSDATITYWHAAGDFACKINDRCNDRDTWKITEIKMKDRGSAIFTFTYTDWDLKLPPFHGTGTLKKPI